MRIGVISDTHGLLRPEAEAALAGVALILHAGDIGEGGILDRLAALAPVAAVRGNVDIADWAEALPERLRLDLEGVGVLVLHDLAALADAPAGEGVRVVVSGHSHRPSVEERAGILFLNPGSAGRRRFRLPVTLALLDLTPEGPQATIRHLVDWSPAR